jgi:hypothetical protein
MDNVQNCSSYINIHSSQTYISYLHILSGNVLCQPFCSACFFIYEGLGYMFCSVYMLKVFGSIFKCVL